MIHGEVREALTVEAVHAIVGRDPQQTARILRDAADDEVAKAIVAGERPELPLPARHIVRRIIRARGSSCDRNQPQRRSQTEQRHTGRAGHNHRTYIT